MLEFHSKFVGYRHLECLNLRLVGYGICIREAGIVLKIYSNVKDFAQNLSISCGTDSQTIFAQRNQDLRWLVVFENLSNYFFKFPKLFTNYLFRSKFENIVNQ